MTRLLDALSEAVETAQTSADLKQTLAILTLDHGFDFYAFLKIGSANASAVSNYPKDWQSQYLACGLFECDPVVQAARRVLRPFTWSNRRYVVNGNRKTRMFFEAAAEHGICSGLSLPISIGHGSLAMMTMASRQMELRSHSLDPIWAAATVGTLAGFLLRELRPADHGIEVLKPVERLCLTWYAEGKTYRDIADIEKMRYSNVCFHMANIRRKLNVGSSARAVVLAMRMGLISLPAKA